MRIDHDSRDYINDFLFPELINMLNTIDIYHMRYGRNIGEEFDNLYYKITRGNLCELNDILNVTSEVVSKEYCESILDCSLKQGLFSSYSYIRNQVIYVLNRIYYYYIMQYETNRDTYLNNLDILGSRYYMFELIYTFPIFLQPYSQMLLTSFVYSVNDFVSKEYNIQLYLIVAFLCIVIIFYIYPIFLFRRFYTAPKWFFYCTKLDIITIVELFLVLLY